MNAPAAAIVLRPPRARDRSRVRRMVTDTGKFRPDEVDVAVEVFDGATAEPGVDYHALGAYDEDRLIGFTLFGPVPRLTP